MIGLDSYSRQVFIYLDPILIYISLWIDCLFEIRKIAVCFLWLSLPGDYRVTDEALLAKTTQYDPPSFLWMFSLLLKDLISDFILVSYLAWNAIEVYGQWVSCGRNFSNSFPSIVLKLCRCFQHGMKLCMWFWYNPLIFFSLYFSNFQVLICLSPKIAL